MSEHKGKASTKAKNKYNAANYDSLRIVIPKGCKTLVEKFAASSPEKSVNGLVNMLLRTAMGITEENWKAPKTEDDPGVHKTLQP